MYCFYIATTTGTMLVSKVQILRAGPPAYNPASVSELI